MSLSWFNRQGRGRKANRQVVAKKPRKVSIQVHNLEERAVPAQGTFQFDPSQTVTVNESAGTATFDILLVTDNTPLLGSVTVNAALTAGTATNGSDFAISGLTPLSVTYVDTDPNQLNLSGQRVYRKAVTINLTNDTIVEASETINFNFLGFSQTSTNSIAAGAPATQTITIADNDSATVGITNVSAAEDIAGGNLTFNITLSNQVQAALPVNVAYTDVTATGGNVDYDSAMDAISFPALDTTTIPVTVAINNDTILEATETFLASLSTSLAGYNITFSSPATGSILDNETAVIDIAAGTTTVTEDGAGTPTNTVTATLTITANGAPGTGTLGVPLSANLSAPTGGTGTGGVGVDYTTTAATFIATTGSGATQTIGIASINDAVTELTNEDFNTDLVITNNGGSVNVSATGTQTVRVVDNDLAQFNINSVTVNEAAGTLTFAVSLTNAIDKNVTLDVSYTDTTTEATDFDHTTDTATFNLNTTASQNVTVAITNDTLVETATETFAAALAFNTSMTGYTNVTLGAAGTGTITDNDVAVFTMANVTTAENAGPMPFVLNLSNGVEGGITVDVTFVDGTAVAGSDYSGTTIPVTFGDGVSGNMPVNVPLIDNAIVEGPETFTTQLTLVAPLSGGYATDLTDTATGTITDNEAVTFTIDDQSVNEAAGTMTFNVTQTAPIDVLTQVNVSFEDISTEAGDFGHSTLTVSFPANTISTQTVTIPITNDNIAELTETFKAKLSLNPATPLTGYNTTLTDEGTGTITDNDAANYTITGQTVDEAAGMITFTVSLSQPVDIATTLNVNYAGGNATGGAGGTGANVDYDNNQDSVTFPAENNVAQTVNVAIQNDNIVETTETFLASLTLVTSLTGYTSSVGGAATGTITDNDTATFTMDDVTVTETNGASTLNFILKLSNPIQSGGSTLVNVSFGACLPADNTALGGGVDYTSTTIPITFANLDNGDKTVSVPITGDLIVEKPEFFMANLALDGTTPLTGYAKNLTDTAKGTINDNDIAIFSITSPTVNESAGTMTFNVSLDKQIDTPVTINVNYGGGTATGGGTDYDSTQDQITFAAMGSTPQTIPVTVAINDDTVVEVVETFIATLSLDSSTPLTGYQTNLAGPVTGTGTITSDNDTATIALAAATSTATEGAGGPNASVGATLTISGNLTPGVGTLGSAVTVNLAVAPAGASEVTLPTAPAYTFAAGASSGTVNATVVAFNDAIVEGPESYALSLTGLTTALNTPTTQVTLVPGTNTLTITDNDKATVSMPSGTTTATENGPTGTIPITLAFVTDGVGTPTLGVGVTVALAPGSVDFTSSTVVFGVNATAGTQDMIITAVNDRRIEASPELNVGGLQTLTITNLNPVGADVTVAGTSGTRSINIIDNDYARLIYDGTANVSEANGLVDDNINVLIVFETEGVNGLPGNLSDPGLDVKVEATITSDPTDFAATTVFWDPNEPASLKDVEVTSVNDRLLEATIENVTADLEAFTPASVVKQGTATVNITDNETGSVVITTGTTNLTEGTGNATVQATLTIVDSGTTGPVGLGAPLSVNLPGNPDFTSLPAVFPLNAVSGASAFITLAAVNDDIVEGTETFGPLSATTTSPMTIPVTGTQTVVITDTDIATFNVDDVTVNEAAGNATFTITLSQPVSSALTLAVSFTDLTATGGGTDYTSTTQNFNIGANTTPTITVTVPINADNVAELAEQFRVNLALVSPPSGFNIVASDTAIGTITDDDNINMFISDVTINESAGTATFNLTSSAPIDIPLQVLVNYGGGNATPGQDYDGSTDIVTYPANQTGPIPVTVAIFGGADTTVELNETFIASIGTSTALGSRSINFTDTGLGTINNDDTAAFSIGDVTVNEAAGTMTFTVSLDNPIDIPVDVVVGYSGGSATATTDYDATSDTVNFAQGSTTPKTVTVAIVNDTLVELDETFTATLTSPTNFGGRVVGVTPAITVNDTATGTIDENDTATYTIGDVVVNEGDTATFTITLDNPLDVATTVNVGFTDQTAIGGGVDYTPVTTSVAFAIGESGSKTVTVNTTGDLVNEPIETFLASLSVTGTTGQGVVFSDTATGTIVDHNEAPVILAPGTQNFLANTPITILGISVTDPEVVVLNANVEVTLSVANGSLTLATTAGLTFTAGDGTNDATMTFQGNLATVNAALASLVYRPTTDTFANDALTISVDDLGSLGAGGAMVTTETIDLVAPQGLAQVQASPITPGVNDLVVYGNPTDDTILVTPAGKSFRVTMNNVLIGTFNGVKGRIVIFGGDGNDTITVHKKIGRPTYLDGGLGSDVLTGGKGKDTLTGGAGNDIMDGGAGKDTLYEIGDVNFTLTGGTRTTDGSLAGLGTNVLVRNRIEYAHLVGGASANTLNTTAFNGNVTLMGGAGDDTLLSGAKNDVLVGGDGADSLNAGAGRDLLIGGNGLDVLNGGDQDDILVGSSTQYDTDALSLGLIMKTWTSSTKTFTVRKNFINGVNTKNPPNKNVVLRATTVFTDTLNDSFTGGNGRDYFVNFLGEGALDVGTGGADELANLVTI